MQLLPAAHAEHHRKCVRHVKRDAFRFLRKILIWEEFYFIRRRDRIYNEVIPRGSARILDQRVNRECWEYPEQPCLGAAQMLSRRKLATRLLVVLSFGVLC